jgi:acyl carrier protein
LTNDLETTTRAVGEAWRTTLGTDTVDDDDDFFEIGGNSLLAAQLVERLQRELQIDFPLDALFLDSTFGTIVQACVTAPPSNAGGAQA